MPKQTRNDKVALRITEMVGSMTCAYLFAALALGSLPSAIHQGTFATVQWVSQTFLQLVLLSIFMVGQDVANRKSERRSEKMYKDAELILKTLREHDMYCRGDEDDTH